MSSAPVQAILFESPHAEHGWVDDLNRTLQLPERYDFTAVDLFAGCGGLSLGFECAGFKTVGYEMKPEYCETYRANLHSECMKYIQSKMTDFGILSADLQDPFQDNIKRTLASIGVDKLVMSNDPVIVKTASYVIIRSALTYLSDTSRKQLTNQKKKAQGVYFLLKDCMNLYISNGYISEENFRFNV